MSSQETKRQHYIPKTYLDKFAREGKKYFQIHVCNKSKLDNIFPTGTHNICVKTNMYTLDADTEEERQVIEKFYGSAFEDRYNEIYQVITNDSVKKIDSEMRERIIGFVISLLFRTRKFQVTHNNLIERVIERSLELAASLNKNYFKLKDEVIVINGRTAGQIAKEINDRDKTSHILTQLNLALKLIELRKNNRISVVKIESEWGFITSDHPVTLYDPESKITAPFSKNNLLSVPINSKYRIDIFPEDCKKGEEFISRISHKNWLAKGEVAINNRTQFLSCDEFLLGAKSDLELLEYQMYDESFAKEVKKAQNEAFNKLTGS